MVVLKNGAFTHTDEPFGHTLSTLTPIHNMLTNSLSVEACCLKCVDNGRHLILVVKSARSDFVDLERDGKKTQSRHPTYALSFARIRLQFAQHFHMFHIGQTSVEITGFAADNTSITEFPSWPWWGNNRHLKRIDLLIRSPWLIMKPRSAVSSTADWASITQQYRVANPFYSLGQ